MSPSAPAALDLVHDAETGGVPCEAPGDALHVSLDGDLLHGNLAHETFWQGLRRDWRNARHAPAVLAGRTSGVLGDLLETGAGPEVASLPFDKAMVARMQAAKAEGRRVVLTTTTPPGLAEEVAEVLGCVDAVERVAIENAPAKSAASVEMATVLRAIRPHQWVKNVLVFLPIIASHELSLGNIFWALMAFVSFGLVASAVYVLNDLIDLPADRRHPTKCNRPFASGALPLAMGSWMLPGFFAAGLGLAALGGSAFFAVMVVYAITTTAYSMKLKGTLGADIIVLAVLYTLRIIAGAAATGIALSMWLLSFSVFLFFSLAAVKRLSELVYIANDGGRGRAAGRAYTVEDRPVIAMIATSAGFLSVLVLALYIDSPEVAVMYARPEILWGMGLGLLYWVSRTVLLAHRGLVNQDPVVFALTDKVSRMTALFIAAIFVAASIG